VVAPLLLVVLPQGRKLGHPKDMVVDLNQLAPPVHKVGVDKALVVPFKRRKTRKASPWGTGGI
jgi:hypothetical protein